MNNIERAIKHFESLQKRYTTQHNGKHCDLVKTALTALREQAEREKGCNYCKLEKSINGDNDVCKIKIFIRTLYSEYSDSFYNTETSINHCPMCGRRLEEKQ